MQIYIPPNIPYSVTAYQQGWYDDFSHHFYSSNYLKNHTTSSYKILHSLANLICQTIYSGFKVHRPLFVGSIYNIILISTHVSSSNTVIVSSNVVVSSSIVLSSVLRCCIRYRLDIISLCVESISSSNRLGPQEKNIIYKPKITYYCLDVVVTILLIVNHTGHFLYLRYKFNSMESNPGLMSSSVSSY